MKRLQNILKRKEDRPKFIKLLNIIFLTALRYSRKVSGPSNYMYTYQQRFEGGLHLPTQQFFPVNMSEEWMSLEKKQEVKGNRLHWIDHYLSEVTDNKRS